MGTPAASYAADCDRGINFTNVAGALFADYDSVFYIDEAMKDVKKRILG